MIKPTEKQFNVTVPDVGDFTFRYTNLMDEIAIDNLVNRYRKGNDNPSTGANNIAVMMSAIKVALVSAPEGFDVEKAFSYDELQAVYDAYSEKVNQFRFRKKDKTGGVGPEPEL